MNPYIPQAGDKIWLTHNWQFSLSTSAAQITAKRFGIGKTRRIRRLGYVYLVDRPIYVSGGNSSRTLEKREYRSFGLRPDLGEPIRTEDASFSRHEWRESELATLPKGTELTIVRPPRYYLGRCTSGLTFKVTDCPNKERIEAIFTVPVKIAETMKIKREAVSRRSRSKSMKKRLA